MSYILIVFFWSIIWGINALCTKRLSARFSDSSHALVYQYISIILFSLLLNGCYSIMMNTSFLPSLDRSQRGIIILLWGIGYLGIFTLYRAFHTISTGMALVIAYMSTILMYITNVILFGNGESLSLWWIVCGSIFVVILSLFLFSSQDKKTTSLTTTSSWSGIMFASITAICWTIYFSGNTYFIKSEWMYPMQSLLIGESSVALFALLNYIIRYRSRRRSQLQQYNHIDVYRILLLWFSLAFSTALYYIGYQHISANIVNVIKLFSIVVGSLLTRKLLGDHLTKREFFLIIVGCIDLALFIIFT